MPQWYDLDLISTLEQPDGWSVRESSTAHDALAQGPSYAGSHVAFSLNSKPKLSFVYSGSNREEHYHIFQPLRIGLGNALGPITRLLLVAEAELRWQPGSWAPNLEGWLAAMGTSLYLKPGLSVGVADPSKTSWAQPCRVRWYCQIWVFDLSSKVADVYAKATSWDPWSVPFSGDMASGQHRKTVMERSTDLTSEGLSTSGLELHLHPTMAIYGFGTLGSTAARDPTKMPQPPELRIYNARVRYQTTTKVLDEVILVDDTPRGAGTVGLRFSAAIALIDEDYSLVGDLKLVTPGIAISDEWTGQGDGMTRNVLFSLASSESAYVTTSDGGGQSGSSSEGAGVSDEYQVTKTTSAEVVFKRDKPVLGCRTCGVGEVVAENTVVFADGWSPLFEVNTATGDVQELAQSPRLPFIAKNRGRLWAFGVEQVVHRSATVTPGSTVVSLSGVTFSDDWLGRWVSFDGVTFAGGRCQTRIIAGSGSQMELEDVPDSGGQGLEFIVWYESPAVLRWSNLNDWRTWDQGDFIVVGLKEGTWPSAIAALDDSLLLFSTGETMRFDWGEDPRDDRALVTISDVRGCVGPRAVTVVEGTAYVLGRQYPYFWATRGGRMFSLPLGDPVAPLIEPGGMLQLDWENSWCWFSWFSPRSNSICWAVTVRGMERPMIVLEYFRPSAEGAEPGRWGIRFYGHYLHVATNGTTSDGRYDAFIAASSVRKPDEVYICSDSLLGGDLSAGAPTEGIVDRVDGTRIYLREPFSRRPKRGETLVIVDRDQARFYMTSVWDASDRLDWVEPDVPAPVRSGDMVLVGWAAPVLFRTIHLAPDPPWARARVEQVYARWSASDPLSSLAVRVLSEREQRRKPVWSSGAPFDRETADVLTMAAPGIEGYSCQVELVLLSRSGPEFVYSLDIVTRRFYEPPLGVPVEPR